MQNGTSTVIEKRGVNDTDEKLCMLLCFLVQAILCSTASFQAGLSSDIQLEGDATQSYQSTVCSKRLFAANARSRSEPA